MSKNTSHIGLISKYSPVGGGVLMRALAVCCIFIAGADLHAAPVNLDGVRVSHYRYRDENGSLSITRSIPPEYAQKGYDIITRSGKIIKVPPAPDPEDAKKAEALIAKQRKDSAEYEILARRYSSVFDIYSARDRRLTHLNASISILENNIASIKKQTEELTSKAADSERAGRSVPQYLLKSLSETKAELSSTEVKLRMRTLEHDEIHLRFEKDVELFERGRAFLEARRLEANY